MNKRDLDLLGKVFACDMDRFSKIPFQSESKEYIRLSEEGYVKKVIVKMPDGSVIEGWRLTTLGSYTYNMFLKGVLK